MKSELSTPMEDILSLVLSMHEDIAVEPQTDQHILRFTFWISHFIIEIKGDELRYAIFGGDHTIEGVCDSLDKLDQVLRSEFSRLQRLFDQEQQSLPGAKPH